MSKTKEMEQQEELARTTGKRLVYVGKKEEFTDTDKVLGMMFDSGRPFVLVLR